MHWALVQGVAARLADQSALDTQQGVLAHSLIERMACEVPSTREAEDDVGTDDATTVATEAALSEPAVSDAELGLGNGKSELQHKPSTMESAKSKGGRAWLGEARVRVVGCVVCSIMHTE